MLNIKKTDRRMNGYDDFKYRVVFRLYDFVLGDRTTENYQRAAKDRDLAFLLCTRYMTERHGSGPELKLVQYMKEQGDGVPIWATRHAYTVLHTSAPDTIYLRDEDAVSRLGEVFIFLQLKYNKEQQ